jgi:enoyl-CoA hydratase/carnithine racemase
LLLGPNAGRYFLLTGQRLQAADAKAAGAVGEIVPLADLMARANALAAHVAARNPVMVRNTRAMLTRPLKRAILEELRSGLLMEAFSSLSGAEWVANSAT